MPGLKDVNNIWKNIREVDLRPIREAALQSVKIAVVGAPGSGRHTLANQMRSDPTHPHIHTQTPLMVADLESADRAAGADLIILVIDPVHASAEQERKLAEKWTNIGRKVIIFVNKIDLFPENSGLEDSADWPASRTVYGSSNNPASLLGGFVPTVIDLLPDQLLSLGRHFPLFRVPIATQLINEACISNAVYSISTGLAESFPALGLPLNVADMVMLTKAQAFLVYKLGLTIGFSTRWQDYLAEFGSVVGGGFLWRQVARQLVGLIPVWGIVPKVAVAYSGTYVVGHAVLQWYVTGRHLSPQQMRALYSRAFTRGKELAGRLIPKRTSKPKVKPKGKRKKQAKLPATVDTKDCSACGRSSATDAVFCQYCGETFPASPEEPAEASAAEPPASLPAPEDGPAEGDA